MIHKRENLPTADPGRSYQRGEDWRDSASCAGLDVNDFVPDGQGACVPPEVLRVCASCPSVQACLDFALTTKEQYGFWAGTSPRERRGLKPGDTPPLLTRLCIECGDPTARRRGRRCTPCKADRELAASRARDLVRRETNQHAAQEAS